MFIFVTQNGSFPEHVYGFHCLNRWMWHLQSSGHCVKWWIRTVEVDSSLPGKFPHLFNRCGARWLKCCEKLRKECFIIIIIIVLKAFSHLFKGILLKLGQIATNTHFLKNKCKLSIARHFIVNHLHWFSGVNNLALDYHRCIRFPKHLTEMGEFPHRYVL